MPLIKTDHKLEGVSFLFDGLGDVSDIQIIVNYSVDDSVTKVSETRGRKTVSVWGDLDASQTAAVKQLGKKLRALAAQV